VETNAAFKLRLFHMTKLFLMYSIALDGPIRGVKATGPYQEIELEA